MLTFFNEIVITLFRLRAVLVAFMTPPINLDPNELNGLDGASCEPDDESCYRKKSGPM